MHRSNFQSHHPSNLQRPRGYEEEIEYSCPTGFVLDRTGLDRATFPETNQMKWRCEVWGDWSPHVQPRCVRKCLLKLLKGVQGWAKEWTLGCVNPAS